jgi:hypothetical protein
MAAVYRRVVLRQGFTERKNRTSQEEGLAPADSGEFDERGQAPLPDLFYSISQKNHHQRFLSNR